MHVLRSGKQPAKAPRREAFFVLISDNEGQPTFVNVTNQLGKPMPFTKPAATCAMRVSPDVVAFSLLSLTKRTAKKVGDSELTIPREVLARLERRSPKLELAERELHVEILLPVAGAPDHADEHAELAGLMGVEEGAASTKPELVTVTWKFKVEQDDAGIIELHPLDGSDTTLEMPKGAVKASLYLKSPVAGRVLAVSFIGHLPGRPGQLETPARVSGQILALMSQLPEFRFLARIEDVRLGLRPAGVWVAPTAPKIAGNLPVALFNSTEETTPFANGTVKVEVDLINARERLLYHLTPSREIADEFERFRPIVTQFVSQTVETVLGPAAVRQAVMEIVLSEVSTGTTEDLTKAMEALARGAFFTPGEAAPMG